MCGISGIISPGAEPSMELLQRMTRTMRHRGPDEEGFHALGPAALGFQRLAILDLVQGQQPMSNENDRYWIVFNGEIYNHAALRRELEATGRHRFKTTHSDTEVILHLYEEFGQECVQRLRGMFAFAIWDRERQMLFAARDRFGKKPFFYFLTSAGGLVFASELKALVLHPHCPRNIDTGAINLYLNLQYIPSPRTIYKGVAKLPPAFALEWSPESGLKTFRYWDLRYEPATSLSYADAKARLRTLLTEAVQLRMVADVPLGAFLSGGIDSSVIVALMAQLSSRPVQTFSIGFKESAYSELPYARAVAERYQTDHHEFVVEAHLTDVLPKLAWLYSEPYADSSALPSYYLARETRRHVTVALNGDGGDEMFGGYLRYRAALLSDHWDLLPGAIKRMAYAASLRWPVQSQRSVAYYGQRFLQLASLPRDQRYSRTLHYFHPEELAELWTPDAWKEVYRPENESDDLFADTFRAYRPEDPLHAMLYQDLHHYLPDCLMVKVDIATMAHSLEGRSPFLDHVLAEEVARWPAHWKFRLPNSSKRILRDTFARDLPPAVLNRGKMGFGIPLAEWFRGPLKEFLLGTVLSPRALGRGYFKPEAIRAVVEEHLSGRRNRGYGLWALLMLELWHQAVHDGSHHD